MIPAMAQAMATPMVFFAPFAKASVKVLDVSLVSLLNMLTTTAVRIA
jgi:hypothetical protein